MVRAQAASFALSVWTDFLWKNLSPSLQKQKKGLGLTFTPSIDTDVITISGLNSCVNYSIFLRKASYLSLDITTINTFPVTPDVYYSPSLFASTFLMSFLV